MNGKHKGELTISDDKQFDFSIKTQNRSGSGDWDANSLNIEHELSSGLGESVTITELWMSDAALKDKKTFEFIELMASKNIYPSPYNFSKIADNLNLLGIDKAFEYYVKQEIGVRENQIQNIMNDAKEKCVFYENKIKELQNLLAQ